MIADELTRALFTQIVLLAVGFETIFLYLCTLAIGAVKGNFDYHNSKITLYFLNAKFL
jgi:hypothetical protein